MVSSEEEHPRWGMSLESTYVGSSRGCRAERATPANAARRHDLITFEVAACTEASWKETRTMHKCLGY